MDRFLPLAIAPMLLLWILLGSTQALAADREQVHLRGATFDPLRDAEPRPAERLPEGPRLRNVSDATPAWLVQLRRPVTRETRRRLARGGATVVGYVPRRTLLVRVPAKTGPELLRSLPWLRWSAPFRPAYRVAPRILETLRGTDGDASIDVLLFPGVAPGPIADAIARLWADVAVVYTKLGERPSLTLDVPVARLAPVVGSLIRDPDVLFVSRRPTLELHNDNGVWIGQSYDRVEGPVEALEPDPKPYTDSATIWNHGLRGEGQVIAVADTGLEHGMCYFDDPQNPVIPQAVAPPAPLVLDSGHRKLLALNAPLVGSLHLDDPYRHGTHVAGTAVGDNLAHAADGTGAGHDHADGLAPGARLIFEDISGAVNAACFIGIVVGSVEDLLVQEYDAGARISNNSWGSSASAGFDTLAYETDAAVWSHEEMLVVVSAGNDGAGGVAGLSLCKNCVAVGASETYDATFLDRFGFLDPENMAAFSSRGPTPDGRIKPDVVFPGYVVTSSRFPVTYVEDEADPQCDDADPEVCLPDFGGCYVTDPSQDCHADGLLGTSMASPAVAGLAALARQYFTEGFYPTGQGRIEDALVPSAALLKAVLINGARNLTGRLLERRDPPQDLGPLSDTPSDVQGWGRVMLDDALYFDGDSRSLFLFDVPNATGLVGAETIDVTLSVSSSTEPFKATLVWSDVAALPVSGDALVNDLDLVATAPDGTVYRGNQWTSDDPQTPGDKLSAPGAAGKDEVNNVEGVLLAAPAPGIYTVSVDAGEVPLGPQGAALVVTGDVQPCTTTPAPQDVTVDAVASGQVDLSWDAVPGAAGYVVRRNSSGCGSPMAADQAFPIPGEQTSFADATVSPLSTYHYTVRAVVSPEGCETTDGLCVSASTPAPAPAPPPIFDLTAERRNVTGTRIDVAWDAQICPAPGRHLLHGDLGDVESTESPGAECGLPASPPFHWIGVPPGDLWFLVVGNDGDATEGSWGERSDGAPRHGGAPSALCGMLFRNDDGVCP